MADLKPGDVVTVGERMTVADFLNEADREIIEAIKPGVATGPIIGALSNIVDALRAVDARLRKAGM